MLELICTLWLALLLPSSAQSSSKMITAHKKLSGNGPCPTFLVTSSWPCLRPTHLLQLQDLLEITLSLLLSIIHMLLKVHTSLPYQNLTLRQCFCLFSLQSDGTEVSCQTGAAQSTVVCQISYPVFRTGQQVQLACLSNLEQYPKHFLLLFFPNSAFIADKSFLDFTTEALKRNKLGLKICDYLIKGLPD